MHELTWALFRVGSCWGPGRLVSPDDGTGWDKFPVLAAAIKHPIHGWTLFDTGYDKLYFRLCRQWTHRWLLWGLPARLPPAEDLGRQLKQAGIESISQVVISHFHLDHCAGLHRFSNSQLIYSDAAWQAVESLHGWGAARRIYHPAVVPPQIRENCRVLKLGEGTAWEGFEQSWDLFGDDTLRLIHLPGHMSGQLGAYFCSGGQKVFLVADALWKAANLFGRAPGRLARFIIENPADFGQTIQRLRGLAAREPAMFFLPSHCAASFSQARVLLRKQGGYVTDD
jgi:glyoxylase-like metal-dependent hydrolase (beta-lactamase superfamily II)